METFQLVLIGLIVFFVGFGLKDGFIVAVGRLLGGVIGFLAARFLYVPVAGWIDFLPESAARILVFLFLFLLLSRVAGWAFKALDRIYHFLAIVPFMKSFNRLLGGLLGLLEAVIILGGTLWLIRTMHLLPMMDPFYDRSLVAQWLFAGFSFALGSIL